MKTYIETYTWGQSCPNETLKARILSEPRPQLREATFKAYVAIQAAHDAYREGDLIERETHLEAARVHLEEATLLEASEQDPPPPRESQFVFRSVLGSAVVVRLSTAGEGSADILTISPKRLLIGEDHDYIADRLIRFLGK
jgi:hypothetical protein